MLNDKINNITFTLGVLRVIATAFLLGYSLKLSKLFFLFKFAIFFLYRLKNFKTNKKHYVTSISCPYFYW